MKIGEINTRTHENPKNFFKGLVLEIHVIVYFLRRFVESKNLRPLSFHNGILWKELFKCANNAIIKQKIATNQMAFKKKKLRLQKY